MTNPELSNAIKNEAVVLWQYDQSPNLLALFKKWNEISDLAVTKFWDYYYQFVFDIDNADTYGLNVMGNLMGIHRPSIRTSDGGSSYISDDLYRRLLKARFYLMRMPPTCEVYNRYLSILFPSDIIAYEKEYGEVQWYKPRCVCIDNQDMSMGFTFPRDATDEEAYLIFQHYETVFSFPAGIRTNCSFVQKDKVIGFKEQGLNNFAERFAWATDLVANGGIFSTTDGANYRQDAAVKGSVYIVPVSAKDKNISIPVATKDVFWLDWGDGDSNYAEGKTTYTHKYKTTGLFYVAVYTDADKFVSTIPDGTIKTYTL